MPEQDMLGYNCDKPSDVYQQAELRASNQLHMKCTKSVFHVDSHGSVFSPDGDGEIHGFRILPCALIKHKAQFS